MFGIWPPSPLVCGEIDRSRASLTCSFLEPAPLRGLRAIGCGCLTVLLIWLFLDVLWFNHRMAFRDAAHFYGPLFRLVHTEWAAGRMPLWSPYSGIGVPLAASPTASVFYPGQLLAWLPLSPGHFEASYVLLHLLLAAGATYALARELGTSVAAGLLAGMAYTCGGSVLFQYCNVVFLVGAAWFPVALWAARRLMHRGEVKYALMLGAVMALMTLGGDPQMTYHTALFVAVYFVARGVTGSNRLASQSQELNEKPPFPFKRTFALLCLAGGTAVVLAAVQLVPAMELTRLSTRGMPEHPRNVYQLVGWWFDTEGTIESSDPGQANINALPPDDTQREPSSSTYAALLANTDQGDAHQEHTYLFSLGPWHLTEMCISNFAGQLFPTNQRWIRAFTPENWTWVPSLYMGLIPAVLALACWGRGADRQMRRLRWFTLFCFLAACGEYGPGWIVRECVALFDIRAGDLPMGDGFGGVYWMLVNLLPGYETFRFPAKWLIPASLGIALLAAKGWDRCDSPYWQRVGWISKTVLLISVVFGLSVLAMGIWNPHYRPGVPVDIVFGPFDFDGAKRAFLWSCTQAVVVALFVVWMARQIRWQIQDSDQVASDTVCTVQHLTASKKPSPSIRFATLVLFVTTIDLALAQKPLISTAPEQVWQATSPVVEAIRSDSRSNTSQVELPTRIDRRSLLRTTSWSQEIDPARMVEVVERDRATLWPLYQLDVQMALVSVQGTMQLADFEAFHEHADSITDKQRSEGRVSKGTGLDTIAVDYLLAPQGFMQPNSEVSFDPTGMQVQPQVEGHEAKDLVEVQLSDLDGVSLWKNSRPAPRAWVAHQWDVTPPTHPRSVRELKRLSTQVLKDDGVPRDLRTRPMVEVDVEQPLPPPPPALPADKIAKETCRIVHYDPSRVGIEVSTEAEGIVVLADQFYPGWQARVATEDEPQRPVEIFRVNRVLRGVWLPPGKHRLEFHYQPKRILAAATVSGLGWIALLCLAGVSMVKRQRN